ncbi:hypothetical protein RUM44_000713 [Polyplax serrata]|uniref:Receptor ligand binding region domain-containing protein n=1 Tax=Polyplax serrata TaxID=468196 RepID=A0ABR1B731_POLSC
MTRFGATPHEHDRNISPSRCNETYFPDAFLGPVCDYVIAPVARYSATWGIPVLTAGAQANPFRHKTSNFPTLTRMMGSYTLVGEALRHILENYGWKVAGLLYHNHGKEGPLGNSICHFTMAAVFAALNETPVHRSFNQDTYTYYQIKELLQMVAKNSRKKFVDRSGQVAIGCALCLGFF